MIFHKLHGPGEKSPGRKEFIMKKSLWILDADGHAQREIDFRSSAATRLFYKNVFHRDLYRDLKELDEETEPDKTENPPALDKTENPPALDKTENPPDLDKTGAVVDIVTRLAYIMAQEAEGLTKAAGASCDGYLAWLAELDEMDLLGNGAQILAIYQASAEPTSTPADPPARL